VYSAINGDALSSRSGGEEAPPLLSHGAGAVERYDRTPGDQLFEHVSAIEQRCESPLPPRRRLVAVAPILLPRLSILLHRLRERIRRLSRRGDVALARPMRRLNPEVVNGRPGWEDRDRDRQLARHRPCDCGTIGARRRASGRQLRAERGRGA